MLDLICDLGSSMSDIDLVGGRCVIGCVRSLNMHNRKGTL